MTACSFLIPKLSIRAFCTLTKSRIVTTGKSSAYALPVFGLVLAGPVVITLGSPAFRLTSVSDEMTKYLSVSISLPEPMNWSQ